MLPYSREVYFALFGELNTGVTLAQIVALLLSIGIAFQLLRPKAVTRRSILTVLAILWAGSGYFWFYQIFAEVNFLAPTYAVLVGAEALVLGLAAALPSGAQAIDQRRAPGSPLLVAAFAWPLIDLLGGPGWPLVRIPGLHPIPLLWLTLACLPRLSGPTMLALGCIPLLFTGVAAYDAYVLGLPQDWLPLIGCAYLAALLIARKARS